MATARVASSPDAPRHDRALSETHSVSSAAVKWIRPALL